MNEIEPYEGLRWLLIVLGAGIEATVPTSAEQVAAWRRVGAAFKANGLDIDDEVDAELEELLGDLLD